MEQFSWFSTRRSIRRYHPTPIPKELINQILTAATWAPSAHNRQPWRFVVMTEAAVKERLALAMGQRLREDLTADGVPQELIEKDAGRSYQRITAAPVLILICLTLADMDTYPDPKRAQNEWLMAVQSTAMAGQNLLLAAHQSGLGACWMCAPLFCPDVVKETLNLPKDWEPQGLITLGYAAETKQKTRKPLNESVLFLE
jgi:coenzyme F420-0:L-glutamate ligase / coenzyme F420-1:gamma-L-glutamate ligase